MTRTAGGISDLRCSNKVADLLCIERTIHLPMASGKGCEMLTSLGVGEIEEGVRDHEDIMTLLRYRPCRGRNRKVWEVRCK